MALEAASRAAANADMHANRYFHLAEWIEQDGVLDRRSGGRFGKPPADAKAVPSPFKEARGWCWLAACDQRTAPASLA